MTLTSIENVRCIDQPEWDERVASFADYNYRQLWPFGEASARRIRASCEHVAIETREGVIGLADVRIKRLPVTGGIAYITGGPIVRQKVVPKVHEEALRLSLQALRREYVEKRGLILRIAPAAGSDIWQAAQERAFASVGFTACDTMRKYHTVLLDVDRPAPEIRAGFSQKWRNCLNASERSGLTVETGIGTSLFREFGCLFTETRKRKEFSVDLDAAFFEALQSDLVGSDQFVLTIARLNGEPVAGHVASLLGDTCVYLLGASNAAGRGAKASYLLQWKVIEEAQRRGCTHYDLGGIDIEANPGVARFKGRMGGRTMQASGPFELPPRGLNRVLTRSAEKLYRIVRGDRPAQKLRHEKNMPQETSDLAWCFRRLDEAGNSGSR